MDSLRYVFKQTKSGRVVYATLLYKLCTTRQRPTNLQLLRVVTRDLRDIRLKRESPRERTRTSLRNVDKSNQYKVIQTQLEHYC